MMYIELNNAKRLAQLINEMDGFIRILKISDTLKNSLKYDINEIKEILKQAVLKKETKDATL